MKISALRKLAITTCTAALVSTGHAVAEDRVLEEVIVTGTKRAVAQQDTPISISTLTANDIANTRGNDIRALGNLSPNVTLTQQTGFNALAGGIRGTGTISILTTQDPSVSILIDEFALNHVQSQFVELFDLEQVEIYRGPQGTLFGKNSTGGVIAITSKRPSLDEFGGEVKVSAGTWPGVSEDSDNYKLQVAVDIPLIPGELGFRFSGSQTTEDGFYTNDKDTATFPDAPLYGVLGVAPEDLPERLRETPTVGAGELLGGKDTFAAKSKLLWQPVDNFEAYFLWEVVRDDSDSPPGVNETPAGEGFLFPLIGFPGIQEAGHSDPFSTGVTQQGNGINIRDGHRVDVDGYYLNLTWGLENYSIKSITGYREQEETLPSTYTGEAFISLFDATRNLEREQFQQEIRLISEFDGPFNFVAGGIYLTDDLDFRSYATVGLAAVAGAATAGAGADLRNLTNDPSAGQVRQDRESIAFYADGSYQFNDQWSLTLGARYTRDEKEFWKPTGTGAPCNEFTETIDMSMDADGNCIDTRSNSVSRVGLTGAEIDQRRQVVPPGQFRFIAEDDEQWTETTWRVVLDYKTVDDALLYGSVATGFLAGGYSETCSQEVTCINYDPETNINYEFGYKSDLFDGRLRFNASIFYTEFENLQRNQVFRFTDPVSGVETQETITLNAGESTAQGLEIQTTWLASDNLTIKGSLGYLDAEYDTFDFAGVDMSGLDVPFAVELQLGLRATYVQPLASGADLTWFLSAHYQDEAETSPFDPNAAQGLNPGFPGQVARHPTFTRLEERTLVDLSITYNSPDGRYHATLFGKNLLDEEYRTTANSVAGLWNFTMYGAPLQWGIEFGMQFD